MSRGINGNNQKDIIVAALGITLEKYPTLKNADGMEFCSIYHS